MIKTGYQKVKFNDLTVLKDVHNKIKLKINKILNKKIELADYHTIGLSDKKHQQVQWKLASYFWKNQLHVRLIRSILPFIEKSLGPDLLVQRKPFLRIARPNEYSDNIGYHKDTIYGQSPYEISIHFPLLDLNRNSCLKFVKGSHLLNEKKIKFQKFKTEVQKGSKSHKLGNPYSPKRISKKDFEFTAVPLKFGEYIFFTPALIHGQEVNNNPKVTRFSIDVRVTSLYAPINQSKKSFNGNYLVLCKSNTSLLAEKYFKINPDKVDTF